MSSPGRNARSHGEKEPEDGCPLPQTHGRLHQAHRLFHLLERAYPSADEFVLQLNAAVEGFRNVTFILQNEMGAVIPDSGAWYEVWRERMRTDPVMKWLQDARTQVVHKGDLDTHSTARVSLRASWYGAHPIVEFDAPPFVPPEYIAHELAEGMNLSDELVKEGVLEVERRWVEDGLPEYELLDAFAHCYGVLSRLLADAHERCGSSMLTVHGEEEPRVVPVEHLGHRLPCMVVTRDLRTALLHLGTGELLTPHGESIGVQPDPDVDHEARERYDLKSVLEQHRMEPDERAGLSRDDAFLKQAAMFAGIGKKMLVADKHHVTLAWLYTPDGKGKSIQMAPADQQEKYLLIEQIAREVRVLGADQIMFITETWSAAADVLEPGQRPSESAERTEGLLVVALTARGPQHSRQWFTPFTRTDDGEIELGETGEGWLAFPQFLMPVLVAWEELWPSGDTPGDADAPSTET